MQSLINGLAVLAFVGVVVLLFGLAAMLSIVRSLQKAVVTGTAPARRAEPLVELASGSVGTVALVVSATCPACRERAAHFSTLESEASAVRLVLVSTDPSCAAWAGGSVDAVVDSALVGKIAPTATPMVVYVDATGTERFRRLIGSDEELADAVRAARRSTTQASVASSLDG